MHTARDEKDCSCDESGPIERQHCLLRQLIRSCADIPEAVREADFTSVNERAIDKPLLRILTDIAARNSKNDQSNPADQRRIEALSPYLGQTLICVLIRLPGVRYTIEIDPLKESIVHWEWQSA